jgi:hypothetical protein
MDGTARLRRDADIGVRSSSWAARIRPSIQQVRRGVIPMRYA